MSVTSPTHQSGTSAGTEPSSPLRQRVITGSAWTIASVCVGQVLRLLGNLVFARLLFPEAFGLLALVNAFVQGLTMFSDIGIGPSIVQSQRGEQLAFLNTAWTIQVVRGALLWLVSVAGAAPFAKWYGEPQLVTLVPVSALAALVSGFTSTRVFTASRSMAIARTTLVDFAAQLIGLLAMVVGCYATRSIWAIVWGSLASVTAKALLSHVALTGEQNRFAFERKSIGELFSFGRWVFVSTALTFLTMQVDRLMLGRFVTLAQLGVYSIAMNLASLAPMLASALAGGVLFPLLAHHARRDSNSYARAFVDARSVILKGALFFNASLALLSPTFFRVLYDNRYSDATSITQLLTIPMWIWMLTISADRAVLAIGDSRTLAISNAFSLVLKAAACTFGFRFFGLSGFIVGLAAGNLAGHVPIALALTRQGVQILRQDVNYTFAAVVAIGSGKLLQQFAVSEFEGRSRSGVECTVACLVLVPLGLVVLLRARRLIVRR